MFSQTFFQTKFSFSGEDFFKRRKLIEDQFDLIKFLFAQFISTISGLVLNRLIACKHSVVNPIKKFRYCFGLNFFIAQFIFIGLTFTLVGNDNFQATNFHTLV
jgi:hypothetical protein